MISPCGVREGGMVSSPGASADYPKFERGFKSRCHDSGLEALNF
jgi:hypothetical protein